jgi:hypothetical protein
MTMLTLKDFIAVTKEANAPDDAIMVVRMSSTSGNVALYLDLRNFMICTADRFDTDPATGKQGAVRVINGVIEFLPANTLILGEPTQETER